jgi:hypothetical protein
VRALPDVKPCRKFSGETEAKQEGGGKGIVKKRNALPKLEKTRQIGRGEEGHYEKTKCPTKIGENEANRKGGGGIMKNKMPSCYSKKRSICEGR